MSGSCSGKGQVTIPMSLSIAAGVITVTAPQPGTGTVRSNGSAAITLRDPSAVSGSASFPGGFTTGAGGGATGSGTWTEVGVNIACSGTWNVTRQ